MTDTLSVRIEDLDSTTHGALREALLNKIKKKPSEEAADLNIDVFSRLLTQAVDAINADYVKGTIGYLREYQNCHYERIKSLEGVINQLWAEALRGIPNEDKFKDVLSQWQRLYSKGNDLFTEHMFNQKD